MPERRSLQFQRLEEVMVEVDRLLKGYVPSGQWSLGQICHHLAEGLAVSVEGVPEKAPWLIRKTIAPIIKRRILKTGQMPAGARLPEQFVPKPDLDDRAEAEALRASIHYFTTSTGPLAEHPFFGSFSPDEWRQYHTIHAAHHLSFLVPEPTARA